MSEVYLLYFSDTHVDYSHQTKNIGIKQWKNIWMVIPFFPKSPFKANEKI